MALICEKRLLVTIPIFYSEFNAAGLIKPLYMAFDYKEIMGYPMTGIIFLSGTDGWRHCGSTGAAPVYYGRR